jgi:hypothetical protein
MKWPKAVALCVLIIGIVVVAITKDANIAIAAILIQSIMSSLLPNKQKNESEK